MGAALYRPSRWQGFREDVRYTGHWDQSEVGLIYFGPRYYAPQIGRWISADPLTIHGLGGDGNPYAFVGGAPMANVDPFGLQGAAAPQDGGMNPPGDGQYDSLLPPPET